MGMKGKGYVNIGSGYTQTPDNGGKAVARRTEIHKGGRSGGSYRKGIGRGGRRGR